MTRPTSPPLAPRGRLLVLPPRPAFAAGQLAVGEVIPLEPPPGYAFRAVYTTAGAA